MRTWITRMMVQAALARGDALLVRESGGAPETIRGRTMDPRFQFLQAQARRRPIPPDFGPVQARAATDQMIVLFGGGAEPGVSWQDRSVPRSGEGRDRAPRGRTGADDIRVRIYRPVRPEPEAVALTFFHFGGGVVGGLGTCHAFCTMLAAATRGPVISVDYRLAPEHPDPAGYEDCVAAWRWTCANAAMMGARPGVAAVGGDSMGGNFAARLCLDQKARAGAQPVAQLLIYPATDLASTAPSMTDYGESFPLTSQTMAFFMANYLPQGRDPADAGLSPLRATDHSGLAPALVYMAGFDPLVDQGTAYADRLQAAGVRTVVRVYYSLCHGFTAFTGAVPAADRACRQIATETAIMLRSL